MQRQRHGSPGAKEDQVGRLNSRAAGDDSGLGASARLRLAGGPLGATDARELASAATALRQERGYRVVLLDAEAGDFCSGAADDLAVPGDGPSPADAIAALRVPVVAAIGGACYGVGLEIALACDIRLASADATFALPAGGDGAFVSWGGTQRLPRVVGHARATSMLMLSSCIDAATAEQWGLVSQTFDSREALAAGAAELCRTLAERGPLALELAKEAVHRGSEMSLAEGLRLEGDLNGLLAGTDDRAEGLAAFFDKRPPDFAGR